MKRNIICFFIIVLLAGCSIHYNEVELVHKHEDLFKKYNETHIMDTALNLYYEDGILFYIDPYITKGLYKKLHPKDTIIASISTVLKSSNELKKIMIQSCTLAIPELNYEYTFQYVSEDIYVFEDIIENNEFVYKRYIEKYFELSMIQNDKDLTKFRDVTYVLVKITFTYEINGKEMTKNIITKFIPKVNKKKVSRWDVWMSV
jgi:hypothetical protein